MRGEGSFYYLTEDVGFRKFHGSLEPPLGSSHHHRLSSGHSNNRCLIAQTSSDSNATTGQLAEEQQAATDTAVAEQPADDGSLAITEATEIDESFTEHAPPSVTIDSSATLVSSCEDERIENNDNGETEQNSTEKKSSKTRFESGTSSIPGLITAALFW